MYEELIEKLRTASAASKALAIFLPHSDGNAVADLMDEAADEIAQLYSEYKDAFAVIATAWRDNPKDITLSAYMMKHACSCEEVSKEEREAGKRDFPD